MGCLIHIKTQITMNTTNSTLNDKKIKGEDFEAIFESQSRFLKDLIVFFSLLYITLMVIFFQLL